MTSTSGEPLQEDVITRIGLSLVVILAGSFLAPLLMHSTTLAIPSMALDLALNAEAVSLLTLGHVLCSACMVLPAGKLSDKYGRRRVYAWGTLISGCACLIGAGAQSATMLIAARCLQGVGGALIFASALALVNRIPPPAHKARVMGIYIAVAYFGIVVGPPFGGMVLAVASWRWVFLIPGVLLLVTGLVGLFSLDWERYGNRQTRLRALDISLYVLALSLIAVSVFKMDHLFGRLTLLVGVLAFIGFCWFQSRRRDPLLQVALFRHNAVFSVMGSTYFLVYSAILALAFTLTLYLQYLLGIDALTTGWILLSQALMTAIIAPASGWLSERFKVHQLLLFGTTCMVLGIACFNTLDAEQTVWMVVLGLSLVGLSVGVMDTQIINAALNSVAPKDLGSASATLNGLRTMGGFVGVGLVSFLMSQYLGKAKIVPALYPALSKMLHSYFIISTVLVSLALALVVWGYTQGFYSGLNTRKHHDKPKS